MGCVLLKGVKDLLRRCTEDVVYFVNLIQLIITGKQREEREHLKEDATDTPDIHFVPVMAISHEAFWCTVPSRRDVLRQGRLAVQASAAAEISEFDCVTGK